MSDSYVPSRDNWLINIVNKAKNVLSGVKTQWVSFDLGESGTVATPLRVTEEIKTQLLKEWPQGKKMRILLDRLDDSWDASEESRYLLIGLLKAANELNARFDGKIVVTVFLRSDIYDNIFFDDQDKLRQNEERIFWSSDELKAVVCERVKVSLGLQDSNDTIWQSLFSRKAYRSKATAEKYIIDRTFKRPRDIISFIRFAIEEALEHGHSVIETIDTRTAEEKGYSQSKYKDLIIEHRKLFQYIQDLLDSFSGSLHKLSHEELIKRLGLFIEKYKLREQPNQLLRQLFIWGIIGVKRQGRAGVRQRGGAHFFYYYDDPSINPLAYNDYYIHPSLRYHLNISEKRERVKRLA